MNASDKTLQEMLATVKQTAQAINSSYGLSYSISFSNENDSSLKVEFRSNNAATTNSFYDGNKENLYLPALKNQQQFHFPDNFSNFCGSKLQLPTNDFFESSPLFKPAPAPAPATSIMTNKALCNPFDTSSESEMIIHQDVKSDEETIDYDSDPENSEIIRSTYRDIKLNPQEKIDVENYLFQCFEEFQQIPCKLLAKSWIKLIEPKKQTQHPYKKGSESKPFWWPKECRHKEPDHLKKEERIQLLIGMIRQFKHRSLEFITAAELVCENQTFENGKFKRTGHLSKRKLDILFEMFKVLNCDKSVDEVSVIKPGKKYSSIVYTKKLISRKLQQKKHESLYLSRLSKPTNWGIAESDSSFSSVNLSGSSSNFTGSLMLRKSPEVLQSQNREQQQQQQQQQQDNHQSDPHHNQPSSSGLKRMTLNDKLYESNAYYQLTVTPSRNQLDSSSIDSKQDDSPTPMITHISRNNSSNSS